MGLGLDVRGRGYFIFQMKTLRAGAGRLSSCLHPETMESSCL